MNRGLVDLNYLRLNKRNAAFEGKSGYCFIDGNRIIKIYAGQEDRGIFIPLDRSKICDMSNFKAKTIVFPDEYIYEDNEIVGEISLYIRNKQMNESFNDWTNIKSIIKGYELVLNDLYTYSNIDMIDLCYVNILYSNKNGFHIIDTTEWQFKDDSLKNNIYRFDFSLIDVITDYIMIPIVYSNYYNQIDKSFYNNIAKYGNAGKKFQYNIDMLMVNRFNFLDFLFSYMEVYRIHYSDEMKILKDMKEMTKVLKKG